MFKKREEKFASVRLTRQHKHTVARLYNTHENVLVEYKCHFHFVKLIFVLYNRYIHNIGF